MKSHLPELNFDITTQYGETFGRGLYFDDFDHFARIHIAVMKLRLLNVFNKEGEIYNPASIVISDHLYEYEYISFDIIYNGRQYVRHWLKGEGAYQLKCEKYTENFEEFVRHMTPKK